MEDKNQPKSGEKYRHFKGLNKIYEIVCIAKDCEDNTKKIVVYKQLYTTPENPIGTIWIRSLDDFLGEKVFNEDTKIGDKLYKKGESVKRFIKIG